MRGPSVHMDVIKLLESKTHCLKRFLACSEQFLSRANQDDLSGLPIFQSRRDSALKALMLFDKKITEAIHKLSPLEKTQKLIEAARAVQASNNLLVQAILEV